MIEAHLDLARIQLLARTDVIDVANAQRMLERRVLPQYISDAMQVSRARIAGRATEGLAVDEEKMFNSTLQDILAVRTRMSECAPRQAVEVIARLQIQWLYLLGSTFDHPRTLDIWAALDDQPLTPFEAEQLGRDVEDAMRDPAADRSHDLLASWLFHAPAELVAALKPQILPEEVSERLLRTGRCMIRKHAMDELLRLYRTFFDAEARNVDGAVKRDTSIALLAAKHYLTLADQLPACAGPNEHIVVRELRRASAMLNSTLPSSHESSEL